VAAALFLACIAAAALLATRCDVGQGMLPQRRGQAQASRALRSPLGLAWRSTPSRCCCACAAEEARGPLEPVLATAAGRSRWAASHAVNALLGATALLLFATGMGLAAGGVLGDPAGQVRTLIGASLVQLPGILVIGAAVIAAAGLLPRFAGPVSWALLMASILLGPLFGTTLKHPLTGLAALRRRNLALPT
jgi:putative exporter of polyketide antibiotics